MLKFKLFSGSSQNLVGYGECLPQGPGQRPSYLPECPASSQSGEFLPKFLMKIWKFFVDLATF